MAEFESVDQAVPSVEDQRVKNDCVLLLFFFLCNIGNKPKIWYP